MHTKVPASCRRKFLFARSWVNLSRGSIRYLLISFSFVDFRWSQQNLGLTQEAQSSTSTGGLTGSPITDHVLTEHYLGAQRRDSDHIANSPTLLPFLEFRVYMEIGAPQSHTRPNRRPRNPHNVNGEHRPALLPSGEVSHVGCNPLVAYSLADGIFGFPS